MYDTDDTFIATAPAKKLLCKDIVAIIVCTSYYKPLISSPKKKLRWYFVQRAASVRCFASSKLLVCGDGDLSYSALVAPDLYSKDIHLTATVLESQSDHQKVYQNSALNANCITLHGHSVKFEVDATDLKFGSDQKFDVIQFNFPHWIGKSNNKYNRELLGKFLSSAEKVVADDGEVRAHSSSISLELQQRLQLNGKVHGWLQSWQQKQVFC
eukprot:CAMPEP_0116030640 /NCGR_PEP_ID=MMETSP0321-20121206/16981_1 /TAXON_ID=163516 /ORGANISM="Leptocylindrus danicus var. danicus, Strain B650" /LENGTH=211 /DNA_ID=CAMNT_0003505497 /DNA_START=43 /DNA_END=679 /DNA_ORIENTATION=-